MTIGRTVRLALTLWLLATPAHAQSAPAAAAALDRAPSRFATMDGINLHYKSLGEGDTALVFVHGWACDLTFWRFQVPEFAGKMRIVLLDLPGHGQSDKPMNTSYDFDLLTRSVHAVLEDAGVTSAVFVGHSIGVPVIREFLHRYPRQTRAIVVVNGPLRAFNSFGNDAQSRAQLAASESRVQRMAQSSESEFNEFMTKTAEGWFVPQTTPEVRRIVLSQLVRTPPYVAASATAGTLEEQYWRGEAINVPLLVMLAKGQAWSRQNEEYVRTLAPDLEFHVLENAGHFAMLERPDAVNRLLEQFLRNHALLRSWATGDGTREP